MSAILVTVVVIAARFIWVYPATYIPRWISPGLRRRDPSPPWQTPFLLGFTGVRGIVSLAAALGIPFVTASGQPFPGRDLILFLTFLIILVTLVGQGLMLPAVIRWLGLANAGRQEGRAERAEEHRARREAIQAAIERLERLKAERHLPEEAVRPLRSRYRDRLEYIEQRSDGNAGHRKLTETEDEIEALLIDAERDADQRASADGKADGRDPAQDRARARPAGGGSQQRARRGMNSASVIPALAYLRTCDGFFLPLPLRAVRPAL